MAQITINEISQNYNYNIGTSSFCTVALPLTSCWGPGFFDPVTLGKDKEAVLEDTVWQRFPATQAGLESFVATYRGPESNYRVAKDYSYQMAMTLLTAGHDILACRLCPGNNAQATLSATSGGGSLLITAKYPGTFGNNIQATIQKVVNANYWNMVIYVVDSTGVKSAAENLVFVFDLEHATDTIYHISEVTSNFVQFSATNLTDAVKFDASDNPKTVALVGGTDKAADGTSEAMLTSALALARARYGIDTSDEESIQDCMYTQCLATKLTEHATIDVAKAAVLKHKEWLFTNVVDVYDLLKDKLAYNPNRIISPGWDDQCFDDLQTSDISAGITFVISPLHKKLMDVAYHSRCATALIDIPKSMQRHQVYNTSASTPGYAQMLARYNPGASIEDGNGSMFQTHSALIAPWGEYTFVGTSRMNPASPSFLALMIQRAMILNQPLQYEWAMPTSRKHSLSIGKLAYSVPKKVLDVWQSREGVGVNVITAIPDLGTGLWGNSTLYEVPPATYQALANLSTRYLLNAVENVVYRAGINITFQYNNAEAYSRFYAAVTPILDTMRNVGAIDDYQVRMSADINGLDQVNANSIIGKVLLVINGVVNDIVVDLIALPPGTDLNQFA